ncbi:hypothetical protein [Thermoleptolyngbya sp.]
MAFGRAIALRHSKAQNRYQVEFAPFTLCSETLLASGDRIYYNHASSCEISDLPQLVFSPKIGSFGHSRHWQVLAAPTNA